MKANSKAAGELATRARNFNHTLLPKEGKKIIEVSALFLADLVGRVEELEARLCQEQKTTENQ